jgi:hypothetical protein
MIKGFMSAPFAAGVCAGEEAAVAIARHKPVKTISGFRLQKFRLIESLSSIRCSIASDVLSLILGEMLGFFNAKRRG